MRGKVLKCIISAALSLQMALAVMPFGISGAGAAELMYLDEDCQEVSSKWTGSKDNFTVMDDESTKYLRYTASGAEQKTATRSVDTSIPSGGLYIVELDVRFADENSGVIELYGGPQLGPTVIFDGEKIKTKQGNPSDYATMYDGAEANTWYNIKFLTNGTSSMVAYTKKADTDDAPQATTSDKIIRNLKSSIFTKFNVTNKVNNESAIRSGAVDIRNMKVYKPEPTDVEIGVSEDISKISIPALGTNKTVNYTVKAVSYNSIDLSGYDPLAKELVKFELYNGEDTASLKDNMPTGITLGAASGALTVSSDASEGEYTVRLLSYDGAVYNSRKITIAQAGEVTRISLVNPASKLPIPNNGTAKTAFLAQCYDADGSEAYDIPLKWSLLDENGNALTDSGITIDENTGVVSTASTATVSSVKIKAELAGNSDVSVVSDAIPTYKMTATAVEISGPDFLQTSAQVSGTYIAKAYDQYGVEMPKEEITSLTAENTASGITFENGVLTAATNSDADVTIKAVAGEVTQTKTVKVYSPVLSKITVDGDRSAEIPKSGTKTFTYTAKAYDQKDVEIEGTAFNWEMSAYDSTGITFNSSAVTVASDTKEQTITVTASSGSVSGDLKVVVTKNPFTYKPVDGGFEIDNGNKSYTRPIYASHINDEGKTSFRYLYYLGDKPKLVLSNEGTGTSYFRYSHTFLGLKGGKWLDEMKNITARYVNGHEEYVIKDDSFEGEIKLTYTRSNLLDAMLIKAELPDSVKDKLVIATAGGNRIQAAQPTGGNSTKLEFETSDTTSTVPNISGNSFSIKGDYLTISGTSSVKMNYAAKDAAMYSVGIDDLLNSTAANQPMVVGNTEGNTENTVYMLLTTEAQTNEYFGKYETQAKDIFDRSIEYFDGVSQTVKIDTPDPYINSAMRAQVMAMDNIWDDPVITHGTIGWHNGQGGWRGGYGFIHAGWSDRIKTNIKSYMEHQEENGRIWAYPDHDGRYNMNLVMVDILMQYWEWTGDDAFFSDEGGYDFVAGHLKFMDAYMQVPDTNLYENWLDAWNTDNKWNNGGAGSIASSYTWHAYSTMARIAKKLGKTEDAEKYQTKADAIKKEMNEQLWDTDTGVFGEVRERFGYERLNAAPDLSSVYTTVDMGVATDEQIYQMMRFTDYAVPSVANLDNIWDNIDFKYSSNRLPEYYSSDGLYVEEVMNNALAHFESGNREQGMAQFRACLVPLMKGSAAGQGTIQHIVKADLTNNGHIDFGDCTSQYTRTAAEGIFGVKMNVPDGKADIKPGFPSEWKYASIGMDALSYDYKYENGTDKFNITSKENLSYVMHIPARSSKIESVKVNGADAQYTIDNYVNVTTPAGKSATIEVKYASDETAKVTAAQVGGANAEYTVTSNGTITAVSDPQGILAEKPTLNTKDITVTLADKKGNHTFFVTVEKNDMTAVIPVDIEIKDAVEITDMSIQTGSDAGIKIKLTNNTEKSITLDAVLSTVSGSIEKKNITIDAKGAIGEILVPVENQTDLTPGNNKVTAVLTGGITETVTGEVTDWSLKDKITNSAEQYAMISLDDAVNQDLRTLHNNKYDITYDGDEHYRLPNFYWSSDAARTVLENGRAWWEPSRGAAGVPDSLTLTSGTYTTGAGVPFNVSSENGHNAAFVSLYNQFPNKINIPVNTDGSKIYFMVSVSTNNMQSRIENARITVNLKNGTKEILPLTNPDNIDDWLNYQTAKPYAESGYVEMLGDKAHSNILAVDLGRAEEIKSVDFECLASEVLAGLLGVTVVKGEYAEPLTVGEITFDKGALAAGESVKASVTAENNGVSDIPASMMIALYNKDGALKEVKTEEQTLKAGEETDCSVTYELSKYEEGDYIKAFFWNSLENMKPLAKAKTLK